MFEFHGEVIELPPSLDVELGVTRPVFTATGDIDVRATLDLLAEETPGPWMQRIAVLLASLPERDVTPDERIDLLVLFERCEAWQSAQKQRVFAGIARDADARTARRDRPGRFEDTMLEVALALSWSERMTCDRMNVARELDERLPVTWRALAEGRLSFPKARLIAKGAEKLDDDAKALALEERVLAKADGQIQTEIAKSVERQVMCLDPEGAEERRQAARGQRQVRSSPGEDSSAHLNVFGPAEQVAVIHNALTDGARQLKETGQVDTLDQGRFDTLFDWAVRHHEERVLPTRGPVPV